MLVGRPRCALAGCLLLAAVGARSTPVRAQQPSGASAAAQPLELARMRYRQGVEAYNAGKYRVAVDYFLEADHLAPNGALSFNIARAYEKLDDPAATLRWYRDYLRRSPDAVDRVAVEERIHAMEAQLAKKGVQQLTVLSDPEGASVTFDGRPTGVTPWTTEVAPGSHELVLNLAGYAPETRRVELAADRAEDVVIQLGVASPSGVAPVAAAPASVPAPPAPPGPPPARPDVEKSSGSDKTMTTVGWIGIGVGGAALTGALVCEILRANAEADAKDQKTQVAYADRLDTMETYQTTARVLLGTGAALAVTGGVFLWLGMRAEHSAAPAVAATCTPQGCWSVVRGRF
jgi:tetratricopeptide (TPR) repeat protein